MKKLSDFRFDQYSQFGEDGIIERVFEHIGVGSKVCIEFGAWDGFHLSNTANLWTRGWKGILIEGHPARFRALQRNVRDYDCIAIRAYVGIGENDSLEAILEEHRLSQEIDLLSIDVDGNDYHILQSLTRLRPRLLLCEYNPTIPATTDLYQEYGGNLGCSAAALVRVASEKGYRLVALTDTNCFFVPEEHFAHFAEYETRLERLRVDTYLTYFISSYAGEYVLTSQPPYGVSLPYRGGLRGKYYTPPLKPWFLKPYTAVRQALTRAYRRIAL